MNRRCFLKSAALAAAGTALPGCDSDLLNLFNKGDERLWGMNVHPLGGDLDAAQIEALQQLGIRQVRITLGLHRDLASPYLNGYAAEYVGLLNDYDDPLPDADAWPDLVRAAVRRAPNLFCYEVLNEPANLSGADYVEKYLKPAYEIVKSISPAGLVAAAAPPDTSGGRLDFYEMTNAGADEWCDYRAAHLYRDNPEYYLKGTRRPFLITETGADSVTGHVDWWASTMAHISGVLETKKIYWYTLADSEDTGYALIGRNSRAGAINVLSPLYAYIRDKYGS